MTTRPITFDEIRQGEEQGAPIMIYAWRDIKGCVLKSQRIAAREGFHFRDLIGTRFEDHEILEWAPLVAGERVEL